MQNLGNKIVYPNKAFTHAEKVKKVVPYQHKQNPPVYYPSKQSVKLIYENNAHKTYTTKKKKFEDSEFYSLFSNLINFLKSDEGILLLVIFLILFEKNDDILLIILLGYLLLSG